METYVGAQTRNGGTGSIDWYNQTENHFGFNTWFANTLTDPNATQGGVGFAAAKLHSLALDTGVGNDYGVFSLATDGTLSYSVVPEPGTIGLMGGLGLLLLSFRRKSIKA